MTITKEAVEVEWKAIDNRALHPDARKPIGHHVQQLLDAREAEHAKTHETAQELVRTNYEAANRYMAQCDDLLARNAALVAERDAANAVVDSVHRELGVALMDANAADGERDCAERERDAALAQVCALKAELEAKWQPPSPQPESETPETDAAQNEPAVWDKDVMCVTADLARTLERRLSAATQRLADVLPVYQFGIAVADLIGPASGDMLIEIVKKWKRDAATAHATIATLRAELAEGADLVRQAREYLKVVAATAKP